MRLSGLAPPTVVIGVRLRVLHHLLDLVLVEATGPGDRNLLLAARAQVLGRHVQDTVGIDIERDLDLRHAPRRGRNPVQVEATDGRLSVGRRAEDLRLARRDRRVALDQGRHHAAQRLDAQRKRGHVEQQHILHFALQDAALDGRAHRHDFVRVNALVRLLAEQLAGLLLHSRHARHTADEYGLVDRLQGRVPHAIAHRPVGPLHKRLDQLLEFRPRQRDVQVLRAR